MDLEDKIIDFLANELDSSENAEIDRITQSDETAKKLYKEHLEIREEIQNEVLESPDAQWVTQMTERLQQPVQKTKVIQPFFTQSSIRKVAAAAAILVIGLLGYMNYQQGELIDRVDDDLLAIRVQMEENLNETSVSTRIKAVNFSNQIEDRDEAIINLLLTTVMNDPSAHVRLAAVESLGRWINEEIVQATMIKALGIESDPSVQILLIETLTSLNDRKIEPHLDNLINDDNVPGFIKEEAHKGKFNLKIY